MVRKPIMKFPVILCNPKVHYRDHNSPILFPVFSQIGPFYALPFYFVTLHVVLSSHLRLGHPSGLYLSFAYQNPLLLPTCHMPLPSHPS